jgi:endonuclease-3
MFKKTGIIWKLDYSARDRLVLSTARALQKKYGIPRLGNPRDPLSDLVFILLSNKTSPAVALRTYKSLRRAFPRWSDILPARKSSICSVLGPSGLAHRKSQYIWGIMKRVQSDFGVCSLDSLKKVSTRDAELYLATLPGVSDKVAKCVAMYTLDAQVLPVDSHVHRIARRMGWTRRKRADQCHDEMEALVKPNLRLAFHVDCIAHGRLVCKPRTPCCAVCCIARYCFYANVRSKREPKANSCGPFLRRRGNVTRFRAGRV